MKTLTLSLLSFLFLACSSANIPNPMSNVFKDDVKREYYTGGKVRSEYIKSNKEGTSGVIKQYGYDGKILSTTTIENGTKHGDESYYSPDGRILKKIPYSNGRKEGVVEMYYPSGSLMVQISYIKNIKHGTAIKYNQDGSINDKAVFQNGKLMN